MTAVRSGRPKPGSGGVRPYTGRPGRLGRHRADVTQRAPSDRGLQPPVSRAETAGLLIEAIRETRAPDAVVAARPGKRRWQRIPLFLYLRTL
jgi:hypothetical protein